MVFQTLLLIVDVVIGVVTTIKVHQKQDTMQKRNYIQLMFTESIMWNIQVILSPRKG